MIGVSVQFIMTMRQPFSWILWGISNLVGLSLNLISHNYIFSVQSVLYESIFINGMLILINDAIY
ncbi:MAG: nicotinamide mononucleotide transporter [Apibacter sp.]|nr:nicotinamide mononucleotide transporter [Apibacter sp.]